MKIKSIKPTAILLDSRYNTTPPLPHKNKNIRFVKPINEVALGDFAIGAIDVGKSLASKLSTVLKGGKSVDAAADVATDAAKAGEAAAATAKAAETVAKVSDAVIDGKSYKYFEDLITGDSYWYDVQKATAAGRKSVGRITKEADSALFDDLSKIRSVEADATEAAAKAAKPTTAAEPVATGPDIAAANTLAAKLSPEAIKALKTTPVEKWTVEQLESLGYNASHVPELAAMRAAKIEIVATAEEIIASPWWQAWSKFTGATNAVFKSTAWFANKSMNIAFWGMIVLSDIIDATNRIRELDPNDPNYNRRVSEIVAEEIAKFGLEIVANHFAGVIAKAGLKKIGMDVKWPFASSVLVMLSRGVGLYTAEKYGPMTAQSVVEMVSDATLGKIDRTPGAGTVQNSDLYKKAYKWSMDTGNTPRGADSWAKWVVQQGPDSSWAKDLDTPHFESIKLAKLYKQLDESTNARNTIRINRMIKNTLKESKNPDALERTAYEILISGILKEAGGLGGGLTGGTMPVATASQAQPVATLAKTTVTPVQNTVNAAKTLPVADAENVAKLLKSPSMIPIIKKVLWRAVPAFGAVLNSGDAWRQASNGNWRNAFIDLGIAGINVAQVFGYMAAGAPGAAATLTDITGNLYVQRSLILRIYYGEILGMDLSDYTNADLEDSADTLIKEIATQLATQISNGVTSALGINEDVNDNFMTNITAAIAANTSGDKTGAQKALDAAKLNNPASGMDQTTQKNMLDQLAKANPSLKIPAINPNSTQTINPNAPPTSSADPNPGNQNSTQSQPNNMEEDDPMGAGNDWQTSMIADDPTSKGMDFTAAYNEFAAKYPAAKFLLDIVPVTGTATSMIDGSQDLYNGKYGQAAIDLLGALPAFKLGKYLSKGLQTAVNSINKGARAVNVGNAAASYIGNTSSSATAGTVPTTNAAGDNISESPRLGDHVMLELADGRTVSAPIVELRGNSMVVELDDTGRKWLNESPEHTALKIGNEGHALSSTAQFWNNMIQHLTHDTPAGWAHIFVNLQNSTGHAARTLPEQWAKIWRQQHIALGDQLTRGDMMNWIKEVQAAIDRSGVAESAHTPAGGDKLRKQLNKKDPAMLAVWMASRAGARGMSVAKFAKSKATASGVDANHWWDKIKHLVSESSYRKGFNFDETDIAAISVMTDVKKARERAIQLMSGRSTRPMNSDKIRWFTQHVNTLATPMAVAKMMYDMLLSGEGLAVIGTKGGMNSNSYRKTFKEDDEEVSDDDEEELMYDAIDHMESLYHALKNKGFLEASNRLSALGSLYQEDGVYLPTAIDMITDRQVKIHIRDIPRLLEDNKHEVIRGILKMITMYSTTSSNDINNLITVLDVFNADWPELDALSDAVNKSLPSTIKESSRAITSEGTNFKIYVKDPSTNNIQMVRFGDTAGLNIKRNVSESAKTYKDMHTCKTSSAKQIAEWTCKMWTAKPAKLKGLK